MKSSKISIIGAGFVGSTTAFALMNQGLVSEIVLVDINKDKASGEAMDLNQGQVFVNPVEVKSGDYPDTKDSDIVIITAGVAQKEGETRLDLVNRNIAIYEKLVPEIVKYSPKAILLVVSNPVDILTQITYKISGFPKERVIGSGTVLDTARFQSILSQRFKVDARNIQANIIGEHGDSEIATWSLATISGLTIEQYANNMNIEFNDTIQKEITCDVINSAYEIIKGKGYTNYAVALAITKIVGVILRNENTILTVSSYLEGHYGIEDVYISVPAIVNGNGIRGIIEVPYSMNEKEKLQASAKMLKEIVDNSNL